MSDMVYVVIVETGEYSSRNDWIGGVFTIRADAERYIMEKSAAARQQSVDYSAWCRKRWDISKRIWGDGWRSEPEEQKRLESEAGKPPEGESGEGFYLVEVPLNEWGQFSYT